MRYLKDCIVQDLRSKMVFLAGPRQVGKTTLALDIIAGEIGDKSVNEDYPAYLNWDIPEHREIFLRGQLPGDEPLYVFDEVHKYKEWRNALKGYYDQYNRTKKFLVTGSAKLDYYRRGGDALQGRYHFHRLHPLSLGELGDDKALTPLLQFGGFPEPFFQADERGWRRWQREREKRVIFEDLVSLERVKELGSLELLLQLLPGKVSAPLSVKNLSRDLSVSHETTERYISILEKLYTCFRIAPFTFSLQASVRKEKKLYLWDWSLCKDQAVKFENLVASQLLKYCHREEDQEGYRMELCFLRNKEGREIDFVVAKDRKPLFAVECKLGQEELDRNIRYFSSRTQIPQFYQVHLSTKDFQDAKFKARVLPFSTLVKELNLP